MPKPGRRLLHPAAGFCAASLLALAAAANAGSTGATALVTPQGGGAARAHGDYLAVGGGLNTFYRYFIEVPSELSRLRIQLFDADVGDGGGGEAADGRDRARSGAFDTTVTYSLVDPTGTSQTLEFTTGNTFSPSGGDDSWLTLFDRAAGSGNTVRDEFSSASYANDDGNSNWSGNWVESDGGGGGALGGAIRITGGALRLQDGVGGTPFIYREADLLGSPGLELGSAYLSFDFSTSGNLENDDEVEVEVSGNGGASWTILETFSNDGSGSRTYDISAFIANNTRVRFRLEDEYNGSTEFFFVDDLEIYDLPLTAGHWELRVDHSGSGGDDINALGIRADDGDATASGTELNVYYDSHNQIGVNTETTTGTRTYSHYPYLTSGCFAYKSDFDFDSDSGNTGSLSFTDRTGAFTQSFAAAALSEDDEWDRGTIVGFTSDSDAVGYGAWTAELTINDYAGGNSNYANVWLSSFAAGSATPATNPTANAFRVYLPTDGGAAPAKTYLEQQVRHGCGGIAGPNPPVVGETSCFTVTVRLANPEAQSITFSTPSNVVTANVPGSGAVYAGTPQVSQGVIVSAPAIGGTGNLVWNPGTVAAGDTTILAYQVNVTPTLPGQRIAITGTPTSNGTRAQYVDVTGSTSQARATYLFGPLCELAVDTDLLTHAVVSSLEAWVEDGSVVVEWTTASEIGTAGFRLERHDPAAKQWVVVGDGLVGAAPEALQGATYRVRDDGATAGERLRYRVVEVESRGGEKRHGPFRTRARERPRERNGAGVAERPTLGNGPSARVPHPPAAIPSPTTAASPPQAAAKRALPPGGGSGRSLHLRIRESALHRLDVTELAAQLGVPVGEASKIVATGRLRLSRGDTDVAWYPDGGKGEARGIWFYGEAAPTLYSLDTVYRLDLLGGGRTMPQVLAAAAADGTAQTITERVVERDVFAATVIAEDPTSDYWYWDYLEGDHPVQSVRRYVLDLPGLVAGTPADLTVELQGATTTSIDGEHQVAVAVNGVEVGELRWSGIARHQQQLRVPAALLEAAGNELQLTARRGGGAAYSFTYVDGFRVRYERDLDTRGGALRAQVTPGLPVVFSGLTSGDAVLLDITDPATPRWIAGVPLDGGDGDLRLGFVPPKGTTQVLVTPTALASAPAVRPWRLTRKARGNYLVVTSPALRGAAERLAAYRAERGLRSFVLDTEEIGDLHGDGIFTPDALRAYLASPEAGAVVWLTLAGAGDLDYRGLLGAGGNELPPRMVAGESGLFPSDGTIGDLDDDGVPELAVGRIPVTTAAELDAYVARLRAYESDAGSWARDAVFLADAVSRGVDFARDSHHLQSLLAGTREATAIELDTMALGTARGQLFAALEHGAAIVNYLGHGGLDRLGAAGLLTSTDAPSLANGSRLPVFVALTCEVNRFAVPGFASLGENLVLGSGAAIAAFGPASVSVHEESVALGAELYRELADDPPPTFGEAVLGAMRRYADDGRRRELLRTYTLLGDPALELATAPPENDDQPAGNGE